MVRRQSLIHIKKITQDLYHTSCFYPNNYKEATTTILGQDHVIPEPADNHSLIKVSAASWAHVWTGITGHWGNACNCN